MRRSPRRPHRKYGHIAAAVLLATTACSGGGGSPAAPSAASNAPLVFQVAPIDMTGVTITPLGGLVPPGHTLPTDHIYFDAFGGGPVRTVVAPAAGTVYLVSFDSGGGSVAVSVGQYIYVIGTIDVLPGIQKGMSVAAGQQIGTTRGGGLFPHIDFGLINHNRKQSFVNQARYANVDNTLYCDAPLAYFAEPLRSQMYAQVQRIGADRDGRINYDIAGKLSGNWYLQGLDPSISQNPSAWPMQLAFVYDNYDPSRLRISIGGTLSMPGVFDPGPGVPDFGSVSPASGKIVYPLLLPLAPGRSSGPQPQQGIMIVQMLDESTVRVETVAGSTAGSAEFSAAARTYVR